MFPSEIDDNIVMFISEFKDFMNWRHTCSSHYRDYFVSFYCTRMYPFINTPFVIANGNTNLSLLERRTYIKALKICNHKFGDNHLINLSNLEYLEFQNNPMFITDIGFNNMSNLKILHCRNSYKMNDYILYKLTGLIELDCRNCPYVTDKSLSLLVDLVKLVCTDNSNLNTSFVRYLTKLEELTIDSTVQNYRSAISNLVNLKRLTLNKDNISPDIIKILPKLEYVNCKAFEYTDEHIMNLCNLRELICGPESFFTDLSFRNLTKLEIFKINHANIIISHETFGQLVNLMEFYSGSLQVTDIAFKNLSKMRILYCDNNIVLTDACLEYMQNLAELSFGRNTNFTDDAVSKLKKLVKLDCGSNHQITDITIFNLPLLTSVNCGFNRNLTKSIISIKDQLMEIDRIYRIDDETTYKEFDTLFRSIRINIANKFE